MGIIKKEIFLSKPLDKNPRMEHGYDGSGNIVKESRQGKGMAPVVLGIEGIA
jgi:hypothetical protein